MLKKEFFYLDMYATTLYTTPHAQQNVRQSAVHFYFCLVNNNLFLQGKKFLPIFSVNRYAIMQIDQSLWCQRQYLKSYNYPIPSSLIPNVFLAFSKLGPPLILRQAQDERIKDGVN